MARFGKINLTPKEKHVLGDYIIKHCAIPEGQQFAKWDQESGGTDIAVAEKLKSAIPKLTVFHVRGLRQAFDLPLEPARLFYVKNRADTAMTELDKLRDEVFALKAHVKECDVRLKDHNERLQALEDKYTAPKANPPQDMYRGRTTT